MTARGAGYAVEDAAEAASILETVEGLTLVHVLAGAAGSSGDRPALSWTDLGGTVVTLTWAEVGAAVHELAAGLIDLGLTPGQTVALMAPNCGEHVLFDQAVVHAGGLPFTVYATSSPEQVRHLAQHSGAQFALLHGPDQLARWVDALPLLRQVVVVDSSSAGDHLTYDAVRERGRSLLAREPDAVAARRRALRSEDPVALVYTSGTTGRPKGVLLTHRNVLYKAEAWRRSTGIEAHPVSISYLPYAHVAERVNGLYVPFHLAGHVHFCAALDDFPELLAQVRPHSLTAVPRIWEKLLARSTAQAAPDRLRALGLDRAHCLASTAAPASGPVAEFFADLGLQITSVYGMTETSGGITANRPSAYRAGTVGRLVPGCAARIAPDGELLVRGPILTPGYLNDDEATAELLDRQGWAHTGDLASVDEDGYLRILGRKKDLLVTAGGENVAPTLIEGLLQEHRGVTQAMVCGDGRRYLTALIVVDPSAGDAGPLVAHAVDATNARLARVQQIKDWRIVATPWSVESGELTPTLKLRRHVVAERYANLIEEMYAQVPVVAG